MRITTNYIAEMTIDQFADEHQLEMHITERPLDIGDPCRYLARFKNSEVTDGAILRGTYGNGATPEEAIANYAPLISCTRLVIDAFRPTRREITVPRLSRTTERPPRT